MEKVFVLYRFFAVPEGEGVEILDVYREFDKAREGMIASYNEYRRDNGLPINEDGCWEEVHTMHLAFGSFEHQNMHVYHWKIIEREVK